MAHVEHAVSDAPEHPPLVYLPAPQVAQGVHVPGLAPTRYWLAVQTMFGTSTHRYPLVVPLHEPERRWPLAHLRLAQVVHAVSDVPEHTPLVYLPAVQVAQALHWNPFVVPEQTPVRYRPEPQLVLVHLRHW